MRRVALRDVRRGIAAVHDVAPAAAMHVQVDEAGEEDGLAGIAHRLFVDRRAADVADAACGVDFDRTRDESLRPEDVALEHARHAIASESLRTICLASISAPSAGPFLTGTILSRRSGAIRGARRAPMLPLTASGNFPAGSTAMARFSREVVARS